MDDRASHAGRGRAIVPNVFTIELSDTDHDRLTDDPRSPRNAVGKADIRRLAALRPAVIRISLTNGATSETGVFRVRPRPPATEGRVRTLPVHDRYAAAPDDWTGRRHGLRAPPASVPAARVAEPSTDRPLPAKVPPATAPASSSMATATCSWAPSTSWAATTTPTSSSTTRSVSHPVSCEIRVSIDGPPLRRLIRDLGSTNGTFVSSERVGSSTCVTVTRSPSAHLDDLPGQASMSELTLTILRLQAARPSGSSCSRSSGSCRAATSRRGSPNSVRRGSRRAAPIQAPPAPPAAPKRGSQQRASGRSPRKLVVTGAPVRHLPAAAVPGHAHRSLAGCALVLDDDASGRHARIFEQEGRWLVEDLGSTNGTFVDNRRITAPPLELGTTLRIGRTVVELAR